MDINLYDVEVSEVRSFFTYSDKKINATIFNINTEDLIVALIKAYDNDKEELIHAINVM